MPDLQANPIALAVTERITTELDSDDWGAAIEILGEALAADPDADAEQLWGKVKFAGQRQAHDDSSAIVPRSTRYDRRKAGLEPINTYRGLEYDPEESDQPTRQSQGAYIERNELECWASTDFEIDVAQLAGHLSDAEIAARLGKSVRSIGRTISVIVKRSGLPLYDGPTLTTEHDESIRACIRGGSELFYVARIAGAWQVVERESLTIDVGKLEPWHVQRGDGYEDYETRIWYHDFAPARV